MQLRTAPSHGGLGKGLEAAGADWRHAARAAVPEQLDACEPGGPAPQGGVVAGTWRALNGTAGARESRRSRAGGQTDVISMTGSIAASAALTFRVYSCAVLLNLARSVLYISAEAQSDERRI